MTTTTSNPRPKKVFRIGSVSASVWKRTTQAGQEFYSVQVQRSYTSEDGSRAYTASFNRADLLNVGELARRAEAWIAEQQT